MSFKIKTILLFLAVSLVPYMITMLLFGNSMRNERAQTIKKELGSQLQTTVERIELQHKTLQNDLAFMAKSDIMNDFFTDDLDRRIARMFEEKKKDIGLIGDIYLVNMDKKIIASSDFNKIGRSFEQDSLFWTPLYSSIDNSQIGVLYIEYSYENLKKFFTNSQSRQYYMLLDKTRELFRPSEFEDVLSVQTTLKSMPKITIVLEEDKAFAYALLEKYESWFVIIMIVGIILILTVALLFALTLIKPLLKLSNVAKTITATQDYSAQVDVDRNDEIGEMARSFNTMILGMKNAFDEINLLNKEIEETQKEVVFTMGAIGESRSKETGNHVKRVAEYSKLLALHYGLDKEEAELLKQASPMHDIGKVAIPDAILNKPGKFTDEEFEIMKKHAELGYEMLQNSNRPLLKAASIVAYEHHEKYDGSGYPRGLSGENIHIYGRITALADVFDALGSDRVYKKAWNDEEIFAFFKQQRGKHFDPKLIDIFFENLEKFLEIRTSFHDQF
jgi:response regulator RpfG family c-di-GMP phosphodiesterase